MTKNSCSSICEKALWLFQRFGLRAVTMDDVSKEMSISKKTLYTFFQNKSDLVDQSIRKKMQANENELRSIKKVSKNAIEEIIAMHSSLVEISEQFSKSFFALKKYYPDTFKWVLEQAKRTTLRVFKENIERGVSEGIYKRTLDIEKLSLLRHFTITGIIEDESLTEDIPLRNALLNNSLIMHLQFISNSKGVIRLEDSLMLNQNFATSFLE